jgi:hypothetical protein
MVDSTGIETDVELMQGLTALRMVMKSTAA